MIPARWRPKDAKVIFTAVLWPIKAEEFLLVLPPERWQVLYGLNPMVGVIEGFRWALLGAGKGPSPMLIVSAVIAVALFVSGIIWFQRREEAFVDTLGT